MDDKNVYSEETLRRIIKHIPVIIKNFKVGMDIEVLAVQMQCSAEVIEQVIRLGFVASFQVPVIEKDE